MRDRPKGFSLVELVIAIAVAGVLFSAAFAVLDQAIRVRNALANNSTPYVAGPAILDLIAADLANAHFYDLRDNNAFFGANAELNGREADAISFVAASKSHAPEEFGRDDLRDAMFNEVAYLLRRGPPGTPFLELWRREDFYVDEKPHHDGETVLVYDKVHSLSLQYVSRNPVAEGGVAGTETKREQDMLQDGWDSIKEGGLPRAVQVTLQLYAQDSLDSVEEAMAAGRDPIYTFQRFISLPQIWVSLDAERKIRDWDGRLREPAPPARGGANAAAAGRGPPGGSGGRPPGGGRPGSPAAGPVAPRGQPLPRTGAGRNEILELFRSRAGAGGPPPGNLGSIFGGLPR
jgi:prepilin-type N-terminal cleavage/methylation domain-containing protein